MPFVAGQRNESRTEEHGRHKQQHGALPRFVREAPVPMAGPCHFSQALPLVHQGAPRLPRQHCCPPLVVSCGKTTLRVGFREKPHPFKDKNPPEREFTSVQVTSDYPKHITVFWLLPWHCNMHFQHPPKNSPFVLDKELATEVTTSTQDCCNSQALKSAGYSLASSHHYFDLRSLSEDELGEDDDGCCSAHRDSGYFPNVPNCP